MEALQSLGSVSCHLLYTQVPTVITPYMFYILHITYEGWNFNSGNYLFTTDTK